MRFYPNDDVNIYWEIPPGWSLYCHNPFKTWKRKPLEAMHTIAYWRDLDGGKMPFIMDKDLYNEDFPNNRIRPQACLPLYYCVGNRFVLLEKAYPVGFKCETLPKSLKEVRDIKNYEKQLAKTKRAEEKEEQRLAQEREKLERKKMGLRK